MSASKGGKVVTVGLGALLVAQWAFFWQEDRALSSRLDSNDPKARLWQPPSRKTLMDRLEYHNSRDKELDVLVIGGGATGTGCAVDAALRGLNVACVERDDWSSGTSSKSTKLVHGGVRYLEKAVMNLDIEQYKLVQEALHERSTVLKIAPHLTSQMPIMLPIYGDLKIPYFWAGSKAYDLVAGKAGLQSSYFLTREEALRIFPLLKEPGLSGAMVYYDGMQNDARMNLSLALTALFYGAIATNYTKVINLLKDEKTGQLIGATLEDTLTGRQFPVYAKCIINATGPYSDLIRRMDDPNVPVLIQPSAGAHIILPKHVCPKNMGLIDPATSDGRVLFLLPWEGAVISGTTDVPSDLTFAPEATTEEIDFIVHEISDYLAPEVQLSRKDVKAAWSGLRPLVRNPTNAAGKTESLVRSHLITTSAAGLVTIAGGKWTTYRNMAKETIDETCRAFPLKPVHPEADTSTTKLIGAHGYHARLYLELIQQFGIDEEIAHHLAHNYGDRAPALLQLTENNQPPQRLHLAYPYLDVEVRHACRNEYAETLIDVVARRMRLAFIDVYATQQVIPEVVRIMTQEKKWSATERQRQLQLLEAYLKTMGSDALKGEAVVAGATTTAAAAATTTAKAKSA